MNRLPTKPPRKAAWAFIGRERYLHELPFTPEQLARNLVTHSNVIAAVEEGNQPLDSIFSWIVDSVRPLFSAATENMVFGGEVWYLQRLQTSATGNGSPDR